VLAVLTLVAVDCLAAEDDALLLATTSKFPVGSMIAFMTGRREKKEKKKKETYNNILAALSRVSKQKVAAFILKAVLAFILVMIFSS